MENEARRVDKVDLKTWRDWREVTAGMNGYPEPLAGRAVFASASGELRWLSSETGCGIREFKWKAGWDNCEDNGPCDLDLSLECNIQELDRRYCDCRVVDLREWSKGAWLEEEAEGFGEDWAELREGYEKCAAELEARQAAGTVAALLYGPEVADYWGRQLEMGYGCDGTTCMAGVFFPADEWGWDHVENCIVRKGEVYECPQCGCEWDEEDDALECCAEVGEE